MPYPAIIALNEHAATLHYQQLNRQRINNLSLLIDAGLRVHGYASDISRTYSGNPVFGAMIEAMHELQRELCAAALPGADFRELHIAAHHRHCGITQRKRHHQYDAGRSRGDHCLQKLFRPMGSAISLACRCTMSAPCWPALKGTRLPRHTTTHTCG